MPLDATDLAAIEQITERVIARRLGTPEVAAPILSKLTLAQFTWCIQRSRWYVNSELKRNRRLRPFVQGTRPMFFHPQALSLYGVDSALASERLKQFAQRSTAESPDKVGPRP